MSAKITATKIYRIITYILLLLVIVAIIGFCARFTNGFTSDFKSFYVMQGETIISDNSEIYLLNNENYIFETKYIFSRKKDEHHGYVLKIIPNVTPDTDFEFYVDGQPYSFASVKDLTNGFNIKYDKEKFTILNDGLSVESILQAVYGGQAVEINSTVDTANITYFNLIVSSYNEQQSIVIGLRFKVGVSGVELDKDEVLIC